MKINQEDRVDVFFSFQLYRKKYFCLNAISFSLQATDPNGGWVTRSDLTVGINSSDRNKMISCYAVNQELGETIVETHMVSVLCKYS